MEVPREVRRRVARRLEKARKKGQTVKVNFNTAVTDLDDKAIKSSSGPQDIVQAMLGCGMKKPDIERHMTAVLKDIDEDLAKSEDLTARAVAKTALGASDEKASGSDRVDRIELALRISGSKEPVEITNKERDMILERVKEIYPGPVIYYRMSKLLVEQAEPKKKAA